MIRSSPHSPLWTSTRKSLVMFWICVLVHRPRLCGMFMRRLWALSLRLVYWPNLGVLFFFRLMITERQRHRFPRHRDQALRNRIREPHHSQVGPTQVDLEYLLPDQTTKTLFSMTLSMLMRKTLIMRKTRYSNNFPSLVYKRQRM